MKEVSLSAPPALSSQEGNPGKKERTRESRPPREWSLGASGLRAHTPGKWRLASCLLIRFVNKITGVKHLLQPLMLTVEGVCAVQDIGSSQGTYRRGFWPPTEPGKVTWGECGHTGGSPALRGPSTREQKQTHRPAPSFSVLLIPSSACPGPWPSRSHTRQPPQKHGMWAQAKQMAEG